MRGVQKCTRGCSSLRGRKRLPLCCINLDTATDPACGSGSLLLQSAKILGKDNVRQGFLGQEINITTYNLCRIN
ncbi:MAG: N-6 DNA methylase, partial [Proteiniphilum sp.]|nr:N-6 DNA methylase [Proteiniphilum sp.]